jgi:hypothetical protein
MQLVLDAAREAKGEPLDPDETEEVLGLLASWIDLLARGMPPETVAAIVHAEAADEIATVH